MRDTTNLKSTSIQNHLNLLSLLRARNSTWAKQDNDPKIKEIHSEIRNLLDQTIQQYLELSDLCGKYFE